MLVFAPSLSFLLRLQPLRSTLFPYTTLFRSVLARRARDDCRPLSEMGRDRHLRRDLRAQDRKSTRLNSSHRCTSYAVFCLKKKKERQTVSVTPNLTGPSVTGRAFLHGDVIKI